jgi:hypothetical protein
MSKIRQLTEVLQCTVYWSLILRAKACLDLTDLGQEAHKMANTIIDKGLGDLSEIWGSEVTLYYPGLVCWSNGSMWYLYGARKYNRF